MEFQELKIGKKTARVPIIQGGMGVGVSRSKLAGAVAKEGGIGIISTAQIGYDEPDFETNVCDCNIRAIEKHIKLAKEQADGGLVGVNVMVALQHYKEHILLYIIFLITTKLRFLKMKNNKKLQVT